MSRLTFFVASCSSCQKKNQIELGRLGHPVKCRYCSVLFIADSSDSTSAALEDPLHYWINFTENELTSLDATWSEPDSSKRSPR